MVNLKKDKMLILTPFCYQFFLC